MLLDYLFDWKFGTDTISRVPVSELNIESRNKNLGMIYQGTRAFPLRQLFKKIDLGSDHILVDLGSGKGRVLLVAAQCGFREVHGVEWSKDLCNIAERNIAAYRRKTGCSTVFKVFQADAADYEIQSAEDVFYLFEPFDEVIWAKVIRNIHASLGRHPRKVWIIYHSMPKSAWDVIEKDPEFTNVLSYRSLRQWFLVFSNQL